MLAVLCAFATLSACTDTTQAGLILTPPRLGDQPTREVWYHTPMTGPPNKFVLTCDATGDPEVFSWFKDGEELVVDGERIAWQRPGQSGSIVFTRPAVADQGYYQCHVQNIFGTAVSNKVHVRHGVLEHFVRKPIMDVNATLGHPLTIPCQQPYGVPDPTVFWLYRHEKQSYVIETIDRPHITVDGLGRLQFAHVSEHDGRPQLLYQCAASSPVLQGEYRAGDSYRLNVVQPKEAGASPPPTRLLWASPNSISVTAGSQLKLTCIFSGRPAPQPIWRRLSGGDGTGRLPMERVVELGKVIEGEVVLGKVDHGKTLIIKPARPEDAGKYECAAGSLRHVMTVEVTGRYYGDAAPYWSSGAPPADLSRPEDSDAELACDAAGDPRPLIRWFMNGVPLDRVMTNERRRVLDQGRLLRISRLNHDVDTAVYQCNASNPLGYVFANAFLAVRAHAPYFVRPANGSIVLKVVSHTTVDIDCQVEAAPAATVKLVDTKDRALVPMAGKFDILSNNTIRIYDVSDADAGLYYCNVSNKYGVNRATTKLEVYEASYLTRVPEVSAPWLEAHSSIELSCNARTDPRLEPTFEWLKDGNSVDYGDRMHYTLLKPNILQIRDVRGRHSGHYECAVTTEVDRLASGVELVVKDAPESPTVTAIECTQRRATVRWLPAVDNHDPVTSYTVQYRTAFDPIGVWRLALVEANKHIIKSQKEFEADLQLSPWVNYTFQVYANNSRGASRPGSSRSACNTQESFPYTNPTNVTARGDAPDTLVIYWVPMPKEAWNGEQFRYRIRYRLDKPGSKWTEFDIEDPLRASATIRDQPTFAKYQVQVIAVNRVGKSIVDPPYVVGYSGEDVPSSSPTSVRAEVVNATSARVDWLHVPVHSVRGHFRGYLIEVWPVRGDNLLAPAPTKDRLGRYSSMVHTVLVGPHQQSAIVGGLDPMQTYRAQVRALNSRYDGPASRAVLFSTPEGPPSEVTNVKAKPVGARTILVTWDPPATPFGRLRGYFLTFTNLANDSKVETFVVHTWHAYVFEEAEPSTAYQVDVWAETGGGHGPPTTLLVETWKPGYPGVPEMRLDLTSERSARVTWVPNDRALPGSAFYLNYSVAGSGVWRRTAVKSVPIMSIPLNDLSPGQSYWITLVALDGPFSTPSALKLFHTKHEVAKALGADYMVSAAWFIAILCAVSVALISFIVVCIRQNRGAKYPVKKKEMEHGVLDDQEEERNFMEYQYGSVYGKEFS